MTYKTLKPLYLNGVWHEAGVGVPSDVAGFDYEKAARKGLLEAPEGEEVRNVVTAQQSVAEAQATDDTSQQTITELQSQVKTLETELAAAKKTIADGKLIPNDLQVRLESVSGIGEELAKKAVAAITAKKFPADKG